MNKPPHKFFEAHLDNDLIKLNNYLNNLIEEILQRKHFEYLDEPPSHGGWENNDFKGWTKHNGAPTQLGKYYNIFRFKNEEIAKLKESLSNLIDEACVYYDLKMSSKDFYIKGWFNMEWEKSPNIFFHDHYNGNGIPDFHGYYCVNAEPSKTAYKIDKKEKIFYNENINNRAIISETGHPHAVYDFDVNVPRITIAYDIAPNRSEGSNSLSDWLKLA